MRDQERYQKRSARKGSQKKKKSKVFQAKPVDRVALSATLTSNHGFLDQFEPDRIQGIRVPTSSEDAGGPDTPSRARLREEIAIQGGWSIFGSGDGTLGVVPPEQMKLKDAMPRFSYKHGYGSNDPERENYFDRKLGLFTGQEDHRIRKKEVARMFQPSRDVTYMHGHPGVVNEARERQHIGMRDAGMKACESIKQTTGLGLGYDGNADHGYHDMSRILPKTIDELRIKPKILHEGRMNESMKGIALPVTPKHRVKRRETLFKTGKKMMMPTGSVVEAPKCTPNFVPRRVIRSENLQEYTGAASTVNGSIGTHIPEAMRPKQRQVNKALYRRPEPLNRCSTTGEIHNPNTNSYHLPTTIRGSIIQEGRAGQASGIGTYVDNNDVPEYTLKDLMTDTPIAPSNLVSNTLRGTAYSFNVARPTLKEVALDRPSHSQMSQVQRGPMSTFDPTATTLREALPTIKHSSIQVGGGSYAENNRDIGTTLYETTMQVSRPSVLSMGQPSQGRTALSQPLATTLGETLVGTPRQSFVTPVGQQATVAHWTEELPVTMRETVHHLIRPSMITLPGQSQGRTHLQQPLQTTQKESIIEKSRPQQIQMTSQSQGRTNLAQPLRTTLTDTMLEKSRPQTIDIGSQSQGRTHLAQPLRTKLSETTLQRTRTGPMEMGSQSQGRTHLAQPLRTQMGETTMTLPRSSMISSQSQAGYAELTQPIRTTLGETLTEVPRNRTIQVEGGAGYAELTQPLRNTVKESTMLLPRGKILTPVGQSQGPTSLAQPLRTTIRESTMTSHRPTQMTPVGQIQGKSSSYNRDPLRTTYADTMIEIERPTQMTPVGQLQGKAGSYNRTPTPTTYAETMITLPRNTNVTAVGQIQGKAGSYNRDPLPTTYADTMITLPRSTYATAVGQERGKADTYDRTAMPTTMRESIMDTGRVGPATAPNNTGGGYLAKQVQAPTTARELTLENNRMTGARGATKQMLYDAAYRMEISDKKESTMCVNRAPSRVGYMQGPDTTFTNPLLKDDPEQNGYVNIGYSNEKDMVRVEPEYWLRAEEEHESRGLDPVVLQQIQSNPYNISIV